MVASNILSGKRFANLNFYYYIKAQSDIKITLLGGNIMQSFERYKTNLRVHNNKIYSYNTDVAIIDHKNKTVTPNDWYSVTTSKHINYVANFYGYIIKK